MKGRTVKSDALLLATAIIWGFAFVAQRVGMDYVGPFTFNGIRFAIGSLSLLPLVVMSRDQRTATHKILPPAGSKTCTVRWLGLVRHCWDRAQFPGRWAIRSV